MVRVRLGLWLVAGTLVVVSGVGAARADLVSVTLSETGFADQTFQVNVNPGATGTPVGGISYGDFSNVQVSASSLGSNPSTAQISTTEITLRNDSAASHTLTITTTATPFSSPAGDPLTLRSSLSDSSLSSDGVLTYTSYFNGVGMNPSPTVTLKGLSDPDQAQSITAPDTLVPRGGATFELDSVLSVTLAGGDSVTADGTTSALVPEPSRIIGILSLVGMATIGFVWRFMRSPA